MKGKRGQKTKSSTVKSTATVKKASSKAKAEEKLANGFEGDAEKNAENEPVKNETEASEEEMISASATEETENVDASPEVHDEEMKEEATAKEEESAEVKGSSENDEAAPVKETAPRSRKRKADVAESEDIEMNEESEKKKEKSAEDTASENDEAGPSKTTSRSRKRKADVAAKENITSKIKAKKLKAVLEIPKLSSVGGKVFVVGQNDVGQLGLGEDVPEKKRPALLELPHSVVDIAAGGMHSVCLTESGEIITFGCNDEGALGRQTSEEEGSEYIPRKVDMPERIVQVSAGDSHTAALSESGQVYIWGNFRNNTGPMGLITEGTKQVTPVKILDNIKVVKIASGSDHLSCLSEEGDVYTCGNGEVGQLGRVSEHSSVSGGRKGSSLLLTPDKVSVKRQKCVIDNIWTGSFATFLNEKKDGTIYAFGLNNHGQLGVTDKKPIWKPKLIQSFRNKTWSHISGGQHHTLALEKNGLVFSLGRSEYGRLGLGTDCSETDVPTLLPYLENEKCVDVSCGNCVSFAVSDNGSVYSWGMGTNFQLGHGTEDDQYEPKLLEGNLHNSWKVSKISGGGQHTLILAHPKQVQKKDEK